MEPIRPGGASIGQLAEGDVVELAGYGLTETQTVRSLRFLAERIVAVDGAEITVSGFGATGACGGDSGGPLLARARDGTPVVAGVLSTGSASCVEDDTYVRIDIVSDWIASIVGAAAGSDHDCGSISAEGRCLYGSALWCSGIELVSESCSGATRCGWDRGQSAFRHRSVYGAAALSCSGGSLRRQTCSCEPCRIDGKTGRPECVVGSSAE